METKKSYQKFNKLLKEENERLTRRVSQLEKERDDAVAEKEDALGLLDKYREEYESLIADSRRLIERQKKLDHVMDEMTDAYRAELERLTENRKPSM